MTDRGWPLYGAAFATALSLSVCWTAMPFILSAMGGTEAHVGYAPAANSLAYMVALLLTGSLLGHLDVKRATRAATIMALLAAVAMVLAVVGAKYHGRAGGPLWIWMIIAAGGAGGAAMALYWPFLMSWVSASYEGVELNRRFGRYNGSWSGGGLIGPLIGAWLVEMNPLWPVVASVVCFALSFVLLSFARSDSVHAHGGAGPSNGMADVACDARTLADYRWMSRIVLFCSWAAFAVVRSQFALRFTGLGFTKLQFGVFMTVFCLCNFLALVSAGRWAFWHFKPTPIVLAQLMLAVALFMVIYGSTLGIFLLSSVILGLAFGFAYSSHLYYGASTSRNRSARMAIHEIVISLGITTGAGPSGYLAENLGSYAPYWFAIGIVGLGLVAQMGIHLTTRVTAIRRRHAAES